MDEKAMIHQTTVGSVAMSSPLRQRDPLARAMRLLGVMIESDADSFGVRQLAARISVSASTVHRLLGDLERMGLVARSEEGNYKLGLELYRLAWSATARFPLRQAAHDALAELALRSEETAFLGLYDEVKQQMMFATCVESQHPLRYVMELNRWMPLHAGASGHAILAFLPEDVRNEICESTALRAETERTITTSDELVKKLDEVKQKGYAISSGQRIRGALAIAAPVFGPHGRVIGDVGITMPADRFQPAKLERRLVRLVTEAAATATARIGGSRSMSSQDI